MKSFKKLKKNNKGFSLVEVLVTMLIIAIVSVPIIRSFVVSANINHKSRRLQNATDTAQNVSESFSTLTTESLLKNYDVNGNKCSSFYKDEESGIMVFQNIGDGHTDASNMPYFKGMEGEKFYVTVVLNPSNYSNSEGNNINSFVTPNISDIFGNGNVTAFKQFTRYDDRIINSFRNVYPELTSLEKKNIVKSCKINIKETEVDTKLLYEVTLKVTYTYTTDPSKYISYDFVIGSGTLAQTEKMPDVYLAYSTFDTVGGLNGLARDKIEITCTDCSKAVNVYLIEQTSARKLSAGNIVFNQSEDDKASLFSNVVGLSQKLTAGTNTMLTLYSVNVYIRYDKKDTNKIENYIDGKNDNSDVFTSVSTVKEE